MRSRIHIPEEAEEVSKPMTGESREFKHRRARITKEDIRKAGFTEGCPGCKAVNRGSKYHEEHTEECRTRVEKVMIEEGEEKYIRAEKRKRGETETDETKVRKVEVTSSSNDPFGSMVARDQGGVMDEDVKEQEEAEAIREMEEMNK